MRDLHLTDLQTLSHSYYSFTHMITISNLMLKNAQQCSVHLWEDHRRLDRVKEFDNVDRNREMKNFSRFEIDSFFSKRGCQGSWTNTIPSGFISLRDHSSRLGVEKFRLFVRSTNQQTPASEPHRSVRLIPRPIVSSYPQSLHRVTFLRVLHSREERKDYLLSSLSFSYIVHVDNHVVLTDFVRDRTDISYSIHRQHQSSLVFYFFARTFRPCSFKSEYTSRSEQQTFR